MLVQLTAYHIAQLITSFLFAFVYLLSFVYMLKSKGGPGAIPPREKKVEINCKNLLTNETRSGTIITVEHRGVDAEGARIY